MLFQIAAFPFLVFYFPESNLCLFLRPEIFCPQLSQGNILIPAFSIGRTQELLYVFKRYFQAWGLEHWLIFLGSPMAIEATAVYRRHRRLYDAPARALWAQEGDLFDLPNLRVCPDPDDSRRLNAFRSGAIIIAGSGMCTGGRIKQRLKHQVWREHTHVIITGFQSQGTLGRALVDGARYTTCEAKRSRSRLRFIRSGVCPPMPIKMAWSTGMVRSPATHRSHWSTANLPPWRHWWNAYSGITGVKLSSRPSVSALISPAR